MEYNWLNLWFSIKLLVLGDDFFHMGVAVQLEYVFQRGHPTPFFFSFELTYTLDIFGHLWTSIACHSPCPRVPGTAHQHRAPRPLQPSSKGCRARLSISSTQPPSPRRSPASSSRRSAEPWQQGARNLRGVGMKESRKNGKEGGKRYDPTINRNKTSNEYY